MGSLPELPQKLEYPFAKREETVIDNYHGVLVSDPYRWLEDADAADVKEFIDAQRTLTEDLLSRCDMREKLRKRITALFDFPRYDGLIKRGNKYFYFHNTGLQAQSVLYTQTSVEDQGEILLDPNKLSDDGTVALALSTFSENGEYLAIGIRSNGSDWINIKVMKVAIKAWEQDSLSWVKFSTISWTHDHKGFFFSRYPAPNLEDSAGAGTETNINLNHQLYYHVLGTEQSEDILCWQDTLNPNLRFESEVTHDGKYLVVYVRHGCDTTNKLYYYDLSSFESRLLKREYDDCNLLPLVKLIDNFDAQYDLVANDGTIFTFRTNKDAPRYKLVRVDLNKPDTWHDVIPESSIDVKYILEIRDLESGNLIQVLPIDIGSVYNISGRRDEKEIFFSFTSFLTPGIIYKCNLGEEVPRLEVFRESIVQGFDRTMFETSQVFAESKDGTKVPMFIVSRKGVELNGQNPALMFAYGGFNISITPFFSVSRIVYAQHCGGLFAIANIRGGGEYGDEWHNAGRLANKQNCFDDFISCAEFLVNAGYTSPAKLCIEGGSNGGLLVAACVNQRPDLFGCALAHVGVMDMLRFHRFTIGHAWTTEFGCSDKEEEFHWLIKYSPLHNVRRPWEPDHTKEGVQYPAMMLLTADHDDRVVPLHSLKLLATLQYELCTKVMDGKQTNPIIGRIETKAGHGAGKPTQKLIEEATDKFAFLARVVDAQWLD